MVGTMTMTTETARAGFTYVTHEDGTDYLADLRRALDGGGIAAIDLETTGLLPPPATLTWAGKRGVTAFVVSLSVTVWPDGGEAWNGVLTYPESEVLREVMRALRGRTVVAHNAQFEVEWLAAVTGEVPPITADTVDLARLAVPQVSAGLNALVEYGYGDAYGIDVRPAALAKALAEDAEAVWEYNALDTWYTARLYRDLTATLTPAESAVARYVWQPLTGVLAGLNAGPALWIDAEKAETMRARYREGTDRALADFLAAVPARGGGEVWNPRSSPQMQDLFYERLGLTVQRNREGKATVDADALRALAAEHPGAESLLRYRDLAKAATMLDTYTEHAQATGRLPAHYAARTATGRLACARENLQQIPRGELRTIFGAPEGRTLVVADYSQVELRLAAAVADEQNMLAAYRDGADLHTRTAAALAGVREDQVTPDQRTAAKAANFGLLYGMGARAYRDHARSAYGVEMTEAEATATRATFFRTYPALTQWHEWTRRTLAGQVDASGTAWLWLNTGARMAWPEYRTAQARCERQAINAQVQGLAAVVLFRALVEMDRTIAAGYAEEARLVGTVHDSVLYEVDDDAAEDFVETLREVMEDEALLDPVGLRLPVPLVADVDTGRYWN